MQRYLYCKEQPPYFNMVPAYNRAPVSAKPCTFHDAEMQTPWSHRPMAPKAPSPFGSHGDHRSSIDQDSLSTGSVWSPGTNESYIDYDSASDRNVPTHYDCLEYGSDHPGFPPFGVSQSGASPSMFQGIAPTEVQLYPETDTDTSPVHGESPTEPRLQEGAINAPYYTDPGQRDIKHEQSLPEDEGIGSSIDDDSVDSPHSEDDDIEMDNKDEDTDYKPSKRAKTRSTRRTSRGFNTNRSPVLSKRASNKVIKPITRTAAASSRKWSHSATITAAPNHGASNSQFSSTSNGQNPCAHCPQSYHSPSALNKHMQSTHTRPFTCTFARYGCPSTFGSKNEWKRHVTSQHLRPGIWRCDVGDCIPKTSPSSTRRSHGRKSSYPKEELEGGWNEFNRKDLFTQHVRRMHGPSQTAPKAEKETFEAGLEATRRRCWVPLHSAPPKSVCGFCVRSQQRCEDASPLTQLNGEKEDKKLVVFEGQSGWEERMEHVGRHLEKLSMEEEEEDVELREWMMQEKLLFTEGNLLRVVGIAEGKKQGREKVPKQSDLADGELDAEGDDE